jgi:hypothetical protein
MRRNSESAFDLHCVFSSRIKGVTFHRKRFLAAVEKALNSSSGAFPQLLASRAKDLIATLRMRKVYRNSASVRQIIRYSDQFPILITLISELYESGSRSERTMIAELYMEALQCSSPAHVYCALKGIPNMVGHDYQDQNFLMWVLSAIRPDSDNADFAVTTLYQERCRMRIGLPLAKNILLRLKEDPELWELNFDHLPHLVHFLGSTFRTLKRRATKCLVDNGYVDGLKYEMPAGLQTFISAKGIKCFEASAMHCQHMNALIRSAKAEQHRDHIIQVILAYFQYSYCMDDVSGDNENWLVRNLTDSDDDIHSDILGQFQSSKVKPLDLRNNEAVIYLRYVQALADGRPRNRGSIKRVLKKLRTKLDRKDAPDFYDEVVGMINSMR